MSIKYNNDTVSGINFVDNDGSKAVYAVIFNGTKAWGKSRNLCVHYNENVSYVSASRTQKGYEPGVSIGRLIGKYQEPYIMLYNVYAGDILNIEASAKDGYTITSGPGQITVSTNSSSDIHVYINVRAEETVFAEGTISRVGDEIIEELTVQNDRKSSISIVSMSGNLLSNTAAQLPVTVNANSRRIITGRKTGTSLITTDYTINLTLSDGTSVECSMTSNL